MTMRLLLVEDDEEILSAMGRFFRTRGFEVDRATEREEAEALLANVRYELVIADLRLSGFGGTEGLEIVGAVKKTCPSTRIILLSAYGSPEVEAEARRRGVDAFLHKPKALGEIARTAFAVLGEAHA